MAFSNRRYHPGLKKKKVHIKKNQMKSATPLPPKNSNDIAVKLFIENLKTTDIDFVTSEKNFLELKREINSFNHRRKFLFSETPNLMQDDFIRLNHKFNQLETGWRNYFCTYFRNRLKMPAEDHELGIDRRVVFAMGKKTQ